MAEYNLSAEFRRTGVLGVAVAEVLANRIREVTDADGFDVEHIDIKLFINGVEFDAKETLERMWEIRDGHVNSQAKELVKEHVGSLIGELQELEERMKAKLPWSEIE